MQSLRFVLTAFEISYPDGVGGPLISACCALFRVVLLYCVFSGQIPILTDGTHPSFGQLTK